MQRAISPIFSGVFRSFGRPGCGFAGVGKPKLRIMLRFASPTVRLKSFTIAAVKEVCGFFRVRVCFRLANRFTPSRPGHEPGRCLFYYTPA